MRFLLLISTIAQLMQTVYTDVRFITPGPGTVLTGGSVIQVAWQESGIPPSLVDFSAYQLFLCAGGNDASSIAILAVLASQGVYSNGNHVAGTVIASLGANTPINAYFLKMVSTVKSGGSITNYSPRFTFTGMTGTFPPNVLVGLQSITGLDGPPSQISIGMPLNSSTAAPRTSSTLIAMPVAPTTISTSTSSSALSVAAVPSAPASSSSASILLPPIATDGFHLPYSMQTGPVRYAPMQKRPPTKITKTVKTPLYPPSPYSIAMTALPPASATLTVTPGLTWSYAQRVNTAPPASRGQRGVTSH